MVNHEGALFVTIVLAALPLALLLVFVGCQAVGPDIPRARVRFMLKYDPNLMINDLKAEINRVDFLIDRGTFPRATVTLLADGTYMSSAPGWPQHGTSNEDNVVVFPAAHEQDPVSGEYVVFWDEDEDVLSPTDWTARCNAFRNPTDPVPTFPFAPDRGAVSLAVDKAADPVIPYDFKFTLRADGKTVAGDPQTAKTAKVALSLSYTKLNTEVVGVTFKITVNGTAKSIPQLTASSPATQPGFDGSTIVKVSATPGNSNGRWELLIQNTLAGQWSVEYEAQKKGGGTFTGGPQMKTVTEQDAAQPPDRFDFVR